jgi:hypothetical protein
MQLLGEQAAVTHLLSVLSEQAACLSVGHVPPPGLACELCSTVNNKQSANPFTQSGACVSSLRCVGPWLQQTHCRALATYGSAFTAPAASALTALVLPPFLSCCCCCRCGAGSPVAHSLPPQS